MLLEGVKGCVYSLSLSSSNRLRNFKCEIFKKNKEKCFKNFEFLYIV